MEGMMTRLPVTDSTPNAKFRNAVALWLVFITVNIIINGTVPFMLGADMRAWTTSTAKSLLYPLLLYGGIFLVVPLLLVKGSGTIKKPTFLIPLIVALVSIELWHVLRGIGTLVIAVLAYLHVRFDLSELGFRSRGWKGDVLAIIIPAALSLLPLLFRGSPLTFTPGKALLGGIDRLFFNPASSVENLFYFGFMTDRLSYKTGRVGTPLLIATMYTVHEMTNPEYWYSGMSFAFVFVGILIFASLYLWRRSAIVIWVADGLRWIVSLLF
jgi:hypothetical protein